MSKTLELPVVGMNGAGCASQIERALGQLDGVHAATVSFPTESS